MGKGGSSKGAHRGQPPVKTAQVPKPRNKVSQTRVTGKVLEWKGTFGWIKPTAPIQHPEASKHGGKVYLGQEDVEEEIAGIGAMVSFFAYADGSGIGAMHCRPAKGTIAQTAVQKTPFQSAGKAQTKFPTKGSAKGTPAQKAGAKEPREQPPPDKTKRETISSSLISGTVTKVRGKVAFIKPEEKIDHPEAEKHKGEIYLHMDDIESGDKPLPGAQVIFFVYADDMGLGAEHCQVIEQGSGKPAEGGAEDKKRVPKQRARPEKSNGSTRNTKPARGKFASNSEPQDGKNKRPSGPDLPRERVTTAPIIGEIVAWKKTFGWIKPSEAVEHADAEKHDGRIYVHSKDVQDGTEMEVGKMVLFHVYTDASGLGAEECMSS